MKYIIFIVACMLAWQHSSCAHDTGFERGTVEDFKLAIGNDALFEAAGCENILTCLDDVVKETSNELEDKEEACKVMNRIVACLEDCTEVKKIFTKKLPFDFTC